MPFKSQAQRRLAYAVLSGDKLNHGKMDKGTAREFIKADRAAPKRNLPDKVGKKK